MLTQERFRVSIVGYQNTLPFQFGLEQSDWARQYLEISKDIPSVCARKLLAGQVDLGLVPVAILPDLDEFHLNTSYCIGANGRVNTVSLLSQVPLDQITRVLLDYQSRSSVALVRVLARELWGIEPEWVQAEPGYERLIAGTTAGVVIGDRVFALAERFQHNFDLAHEWQKLTGLPFVFAAWVSRRPLPQAFVERFDQVIGLGLQQLDRVAERAANGPAHQRLLANYFKHDIDYLLDEPKRLAMKLFLEKLRQLHLPSPEKACCPA